MPHCSSVPRLSTLWVAAECDGSLQYTINTLMYYSLVTVFICTDSLWLLGQCFAFISECYFVSDVRGE